MLKTKTKVIRESYGVETGSSKPNLDRLSVEEKIEYLHELFASAYEWRLEESTLLEQLQKRVEELAKAASLDGISSSANTARMNSLQRQIENAKGR